MGSTIHILGKERTGKWDSSDVEGEKDITEALYVFLNKYLVLRLGYI